MHLFSLRFQLHLAILPFYSPITTVKNTSPTTGETASCSVETREGSKVAGVVRVVRVVQRVTIFVPRGEGDPNRPPWLFCDCFFTLPIGFTQFSIITKAQSQSATLPGLKNNYFSTSKYQGLTILKSLLKSS